VTTVPRLVRSALIGAWRLVRWEIAYDDGRRSYPFGEHAVGLLTYTADGFMAATIMLPGRTALSTANPRAAGVAERATAFDGYFSYAGRYRALGRRVIHEVELALNPAMTGTVQVREARRVGRTLELSAEEPLAGGGSRRHRLLWHRPGRARGSRRQRP
jgi:hypothetical protein